METSKEEKRSVRLPPQYLPLGCVASHARASGEAKKRSPVMLSVSGTQVHMTSLEMTVSRWQQRPEG